MRLYPDTGNNHRDLPVLARLGRVLPAVNCPFDENGAKKTIIGLQKRPSGKFRRTGGFALMHPLFKLVSVVAATAYSTAAVAGPFDGIYLQNENADCGLIGVDGGSLEIRDGIFYGVNMECRMTRPVDVIDMDAILYTMQCTGEDDVWTERALLMTRGDGEGIIMLWDGYAFVYDRCESPQ